MSKKVVNAKMSTARRHGLPGAAVKLAVVIAAIAALFALAQMPSQKQDVPATEPPPVNVAVMPIMAQPQLADTFDLPAVVEPNQIVTVSAEVAGRVEWIGPKEGASVKKGDLLMRLNTDLLQAELGSAQAQAQNAQTEFERQQNLVKGGAAPSRELDQAATQLAVNKARLEEVRARLERTRIVAPANGVLNSLPVEQGEYVQPGTAVADIVDTETVKVVIDVPERDIPFFSVGDKAEICANAKDCERSTTGTITFISELADPQTRSTRMEIAVRNEDGLLHSGQILQVRLTRQVLKDAIMIPLLAVIPMEEGKSVYVVESSQAQRREVELGIIKGDRVQIKSGLKPGDNLIVAGHRFVAPGQNVQVIPESKQPL